MSRRAVSHSQTVRLKPADPFDLIRWLARSQSDPRKAVAELVQNSIDANARNVRIERRRLRRAPALVIRDDGEGVLPELTREEALRAIATNIGCSRKRNLSPIERQAQVVAGKYGIGLLGFWAVGRMMDIRSRVRGSTVQVLRLREDEERAEIFPDAVAMDAEETLTEIVISDVHETAARVLSARRLMDYLGAELRGALLSSGANVVIHDGLARGTAPKHFSVVPRRYTGEPLALPETFPVTGHPPMRVELYLSRGVDRPVVEVSCAGTLVADDLAELRSLGLEESPWVGRGLSGLIDFSGFTVPPGTRRGVTPDAAADAFFAATRALGPLVAAELDRMDRDRGVAANRQVMTDLRRAFRGLRSRLPQYELPAIEDRSQSLDRGQGPVDASGILPAGAAAGGDGVADPSGAGDDARVSDDEGDPSPAGGTTMDLFPPGPLAAVAIVPNEIEIGPGRDRRVQAIATDAAGKRLGHDVNFEWQADGPAISFSGAGRRPAVVVAGTARPGTRETIRVIATQESRPDGSGGVAPIKATREATATVLVIASRIEDGTGHFGIPEPELVDDAGASWRSRFDGQRWQVNAAHEDYAALHGDGRARLRYLLTLLAKEIVQRTHGGPGTDAALEGLVEILAHAERNLRGA